ncbi:MAG: xylulokinase [Thermotogota bacterium]|nr:xylulokinase [Thermotogota bacterium]
MKDAVLSIDLGTTAVKVALVNFEGTIESVANYEYPLITEEKSQAEQDPDLWWNGIVQCAKELSNKFVELHKRVTAISLCGQMHTHVYLDSKMKPLGNAITWLDQRSSSVIKEWEQRGITEKLFEETWIAPTTTYTAPQVCWTKKFRSDLFSKTQHILLAKDYIKYLLTNNMITDPSDASGVALFDIKKNKWSEEAFKMTDIPKNLFPEVQSSTSVMGYLTREKANILKLKTGIPVINGGSDHSVAEIGSGLLREGRISCILGTAGVVAGCISKPVKETKKRVSCWSYPLEGYWDILGVTQTAASSLKWFRNAFDPDSGEDIFKEYTRFAKTISAGSEGLIFLPYLMGERTPHWDSKAKGTFFGLKMKHKKSHMIKAIMEGVSYSLKDCMDIVQELGVDADYVSVVGGGSKSELWRKILSDVLGKEVRTLKTQDTGAIGNLILAGLSVGYIKDTKDAESLIEHSDCIQPDQENTLKYKKCFKLYKDIYNQTKYIMRRMED